MKGTLEQVRRGYKTPGSLTVPVRSYSYPKVTLQLSDLSYMESFDSTPTDEKRIISFNAVLRLIAYSEAYTSF